jgi:hypothetical protein
MSGNYPPGVSASTPNAPWNDTPVEECNECGGIYALDGHEDVGEPEQQRCYGCNSYWEDKERDRCPECGSEDLGGLPCPNAGMNMTDLDEARQSQYNEMKMDEMRLNDR